MANACCHITLSGLLTGCTGEVNSYMDKDKSNNPFNPDCSRAVQMVLDLKQTLHIHGQFTFDELLAYMKENISERDEASKLMVSHEYNQRNIHFDQRYKQLQYRECVSAAGMITLEAMIQFMNTQNMVSLSQKDIIESTALANKNTVSKAISNLLENGCIAVVIKSSRRRAAVYMVNPLIATCGKKKPLVRRFWEFTGTKYFTVTEDGSTGTIKSPPQNKWELNESRKTYTIGHDSLETNKGIIHFNKRNEPNVKINKETVTNADDQDAPPAEKKPYLLMCAQTTAKEKKLVIPTLQL